MRNSFWPWLIFLVLVIAVVLAVLLWPAPRPPTTTTFIAHPPNIPTTTPAPLVKTCLFWGDPHLITFDGARPSFYGDGEFWVVKNDDIHIQGRYMGTKYTYGLAATQKVAIGGPFIGNHQIEVEPMQEKYGGRILVDGREVLQNFGTYEVGGATIHYDGRGELIDEAASQWKTRAVHLDLPRGISMTVFRWGNYLDLKITMPQQEAGQDGSCGNFNNDASDDSTQAIFDRIGARVPQGELMFASRADVKMSDAEREMMGEQCPHHTLEDSKASCREEMTGATPAQVLSCAFDYCFGMNEHALRSAKTFASERDRRAAHSDDK